MVVTAASNTGLWEGWVNGWVTPIVSSVSNDTVVIDTSVLGFRSSSLWRGRSTRS